MHETLETTHRDKTMPVLSGEGGIDDGGIDWESQPASLTTREAAALLGKSPANVRARASKGDFGPTMTGPDGLPRYDRDRVRVVGERMAARQAQAHPTSAAASPSDTPFAALLAALQAQQGEQISLYRAWLEEARGMAHQAKEEAKELRALLAEREETTRETLSHMDMLHDENITQIKDTLVHERAQWERKIAAKDAEIERLKAQAVPEKGWPQLRRK